MPGTALDFMLASSSVRSALDTLNEMGHPMWVPPDRAVLATGFDPLDEVLTGGIRQGDLLLLGGKPGVGKTIASLQWARAMAREGAIAVYVCFEHDETTLLTRLLAAELGEILAEAPGGPTFEHEVLRARIREVASGELTLREAADSHPLVEGAQHRLMAYADRLVFVTGAMARGGVAAMADVVQGFHDQPVVLFVDYVQKVPGSGAVSSEDERVGQVIEDLKQLALDQGIAVVAIAAADRHGLDARRLHLHHFRGSTALAYEADTIVVLNEKLAVVSRAHIANSPTRADEFQHQVVFSVEKHRAGAAGVHVEFEKDFAHYRFHPRGRWVADRLWSEGSLEN